MGCQTGFYALTLGLEPEEFFLILEATLNDILNATEVPAANEVQCGWGANHTPRGCAGCGPRVPSRHAMSGAQVMA